MGTQASGPRTDDVTTRSGGGETVLLVDDDAMVRAVTGLMLRRLGYVVLEAAGGLEAVLLVRSHPGRIDLVVTDVVMPGAGGRHVADRVGELRPGLKVLFISGFTADTVIRRGVALDSAHFLAKPFTPSVFGRKVREVLGVAAACAEPANPRTHRRGRSLFGCRAADPISVTSARLGDFPRPADCRPV